MPRPRTERALKQLCSGCTNDRYNMGTGYCERPGIDAPVTCTKCWSLEPGNAVYVRGAKRWIMTCHSGKHQRWLADWHRTGKRPTWEYWR